jgi:putative ABC transport system permease protein
MIRLAIQSVRARRASLAGALVAILLAVTLASACATLMASALRAPGPGRFAAADLVVRAHATVFIPGASNGNTGVFPPPRLPVATVASASRVSGVVRAVADVSFPVALFRSTGQAFGTSTRGHGWASAALAPYSLWRGAAPVGSNEVVVDRSLAAAAGLAVGEHVQINTPAGLGNFRISGIASGPLEDEQAVFFADAIALKLAGAPGQINAVAIFARPGASLARLAVALQKHLVVPVDVLDRAHAAQADPGDQVVANRTTLLSMLGTMAGISGAVAVFIVAGTIAFAVAQRRREIAALRALGATPGQVRRLIVVEALLVGVVGGALGLIAGQPLAVLVARLLVRHHVAVQGFGPQESWVALLVAFGGGLLVCLLAVCATAWQAGAVPPAEALREQRIGRQRLGVVRVLAGLALIGGGAAMITLLPGWWALVLAFFTALLFVGGLALLAPLVVGIPAALFAWPLRLLPGALGLLASTGLSSARARAGAIAVPVLLTTVLVGTGLLVQQTDVRHTESVTAQRLTATRVLVASSGGGLSPGVASAVRALPGVRGVTAALPTQLYLLDHGLTNGGNSTAAVGLDGGRPGATPGLDLGVQAGSLANVRGHVIAISNALAAPAGLRVGDLVQARMLDLTPLTLRIGAIYTRAAGLGDVVLDPALAEADSADKLDNAIYVVANPSANSAMTAYARQNPEIVVRSRAQFVSDVHGAAIQGVWILWVVVGLAAAFAAVSLVNTVVMATAVRGRELASIRLLGGTPGKCLQLVTLESAVAVLIGLSIGAGVAWLSLLSVSRGPTGMPVSASPTLVAGCLAAVGVIGIATGALAGVGALLAPPATSVRGQG